MSEPTPYEKFRALVKRIVSVPKSDVDKRNAEFKEENKRHRIRHRRRRGEQ